MRKKFSLRNFECSGKVEITNVMSFYLIEFPPENSTVLNSVERRFSKSQALIYMHILQFPFISLV